MITRCVLPPPFFVIFVATGYIHGTLSMNRDYSNNEISFALKSLREGLRLDSRDEESYRKISVRAGPENGHVKVKIGATR